MAKAPFDATEPPNGDFARYIEKLERQAAAAPVPSATMSAARPPAVEPAAAQASASPQTAAAHGETRVASGRAATTAARLSLQRRSNAPSEAFLAGRAAWWLIGAGAALILLAVLPDDPIIETPLPGIVLVGAGLAIRKHFTKNRQSR